MSDSLLRRAIRRGRTSRAVREVEQALVNGSARARAKFRNPRVITRVAKDEDMLTGGNDLRNYFEVGESALVRIQDGLRAAGVPEPRKILDLPCGYGRVLRYLRAGWPRAEITAMELNPEAVRFCADTFAAAPILSRQPVWSAMHVPDDFDLVWCGSLLTHFDKPDWGPTIRFLRDRLAPGGVLILTTHGDLSIKVLAGEPAAVERIGRWVGDYGMGASAQEMARLGRSSGFAFGHYGDDSGRFGLSVSSPEWVLATVSRIPALTYVLHQPHAWFDHQDVWTFVRSGTPR